MVARSPFHIYFEGPARMVSAANSVGDFDVLPGHADFFSIMTPGNVFIEADKGNAEFKISNGIISVMGADVVLFVNI